MFVNNLSNLSLISDLPKKSLHHCLLHSSRLMCYCSLKITFACRHFWTLPDFTPTPTGLFMSSGPLDTCRRIQSKGIISKDYTVSLPTDRVILRKSSSLGCYLMIIIYRTTWLCHFLAQHVWSLASRVWFQGLSPLRSYGILIRFVPWASSQGYHSQSVIPRVLITLYDYTIYDYLL